MVEQGFRLPRLVSARVHMTLASWLRRGWRTEQAKKRGARFDKYVLGRRPPGIRAVDFVAGAMLTIGLSVCALIVLVGLPVIVASVAYRYAVLGLVILGGLSSTLFIMLGREVLGD